MANENKSKELETFQKWQMTNDPQHFQSLYASMKPLIYKAAEKASFGSNLPLSAHKAWSAQSFYDALRTFKPDKGAELHTHVYNSVHNKAKRLNYMFQNLAHVPEPRAAQIGLFQTEHANLRESLGREPTGPELADRLGWSPRQVSTIQKEIRKDLSMSETSDDMAIFETSRDEEVYDDLYHELTREEQLVYEHLRGLYGRPKMIKANGKIDFDRIGSSLGYSSSKVRTVVGRIRTKLDKWLKK